MITLSQSQRDVIEVLDDLRVPSTPAEIKTLLDTRGCDYHLHTIRHCLSALAVHGLCLPRAVPPGHCFVWSRTDQPIPRYTRQHVGCSRIAAILAERGPTHAKVLARLAKVKPVDVVRRAKALPGVWILRHGWTEPRPIEQDEVRKGALVLCLESQIQDAAAALRLITHRAATSGGEATKQRLQALSATKPPKPVKTKPTPKPVKPPKPRPEPKPKPVLEPKPKAEKPRAEKPPKVQAPKPALCPDPPKPTPAQAPQPRALLTPDMTTGERIERIRAHFARALPRLRRDGSVTHLHLRDGQLRHRARD